MMGVGLFGHKGIKHETLFFLNSYKRDHSFSLNHGISVSHVHVIIIRYVIVDGGDLYIITY